MENPFKKLFGAGSKAKTKEEHKSEKDVATEKELPYINVVGFDLDKNNPSQGAFELDWNVYFIFNRNCHFLYLKLIFIYLFIFISKRGIRPQSGRRAQNA